MVKEGDTRPCVTVVVPALHEAEAVGPLLDHLFSLPAPGPVEVIVVDGSDTADTLAAVTRPEVRTLSALPGRARQMNAGAATAGAGALLFLHADTRLPRDAFKALLEALDPARGDAVGGAFDLDIDSPRPVLRIIALFGRWRARLTRVPFGDQGIFVRREVFRALGGFPDVPVMEDLRFMRALKGHGRVVLLRRRVLTSARRWEAEGPVRRTLANWRLRLLHALGVPPERLARHYRPQREIEDREEGGRG